MPIQTQQPTPPSAPVTAPAGPPATATTVQTPRTAPATAAEMYEAMRAQKNALNDQLQQLQNQRNNLAGRLRSPDVVGVDRAGLETRLQQIDARIGQLDAQMAVADAQLVLAAAQPGAVVRRPPDHEGDRIEMFGILGALFMFVCVLPLSIAWARRLWKKSAVTISLPSELGGRLESIERGVEAVAIEVERVGEGQRFVTQLLASRDRPPLSALPRDPGHRS